MEIIDEKKVRTTKTGLLMLENILSIAETFKLLGNATRLKSILSLIENKLCIMRYYNGY